ncbi:MAG: phytanoyl-CoA dioxygenase family protein [Gammaproteobacteria bacterium]|nr:phytanoyl-CoA dioxygenase family protein [Gammaproteobacteria bacterium]NNF60455.1 phytanoyl-CoA dioxygenase family protein [Gammaproteobacteria bacterium]
MVTHHAGLDSEQLEHYRSDGFVVLESVLPQASLDTIRAAALGIVEDFDVDRHRSVFSTRDRDTGRDSYFVESAEAVHCFLEEDALDADGSLSRPKHLAVNKIGHAMHDLVPAFSEFCRQPVFTAILHSLALAPAALWQTMYIFKQPHIGGEVRWHQDASYLIADHPGVVGFWIALEDAHLGNGCLWVQPGGQNQPLGEVYEWNHAAGKGVLRTLEKLPTPSADEAVALEVPAGSIVVFDDHLPHYSSQNTSAQSRHAFTMHFSRQDSSWSQANWLQRRRLPPFTLGDKQS